VLPGVLKCADDRAGADSSQPRVTPKNSHSTHINTPPVPASIALDQGCVLPGVRPTGVKINVHIPANENRRDSRGTSQPRVKLWSDVARQRSGMLILDDFSATHAREPCGRGPAHTLGEA
jgi:hypothetical protein